MESAKNWRQGNPYGKEFVIVFYRVAKQSAVSFLSVFNEIKILGKMTALDD
ncbi:hypothetical protein [Aggregatibacter segnis]|uniref:hypothetical protein n=1 Tax=Aggregatibacter segnis TaxID=739 RepID=UPI000AE52511|nr:hypothetical protein [Aggregatibacter segnis]